MAQDRVEERTELVVRAVQRLELAPCLRLGRDRDEVAPQLLHDESRVRGVLQAEVAGVAPREPALLAEHGLDAGVVAVLVEAEVDLASPLLPVVAEPRQRARLLANVGLAVAVALAEGEELHQLAGVVLVRCVLLVLRAGEPDEHRRIGGHRMEQEPEVAERVAAEEPVLLEHQLGRADAVVARREPVVEDERHPLGERTTRPHHPVEPPEVIVTVSVARREPSPLVRARRSPDELLRARVRERVHRVVEAELRERARLALTGAKTGTPEEALGMGGAKMAAIARDTHEVGGAQSIAVIHRAWSDGRPKRPFEGTVVGRRRLLHPPR